MYTHPDTIGHNFVKQFPEIFEKYRPIRFLLPNNRMSDFFDSSSFLFGSQRTQNISMIFSSIQRVYGDQHVSFMDFLINKKNNKYRELFSAKNDEDLKSKLAKLWKEYNETHGMKKIIHKFYIEWLTDKEKKVIISKMSLQASYKPARRKNLNDRLKLRFGILVDWRNKLDHDAKYIPFFSGQRYFYYEINQGKKTYMLLNKLTFGEFYELTRKAIERFWLKEYEDYLSKGGTKMIDKLVDEVTKQCDELNREIRK